ncbi:MAG: aldo/keto reductase [Chloroflexi bacterium]|nr:aldo/keto reductase [Chloroflexota bacterium]
MQQVVLGNSGIEVSRLCIGTGTVGWNGSSNQTRQLGSEGLIDLLCYAYDSGVRFWDTADQYGSHPHVREALRVLPRDQVVVTTKTTSRTPDGVRSDVERFLRELGTDYADIVLLHCLTEHDWTTRYADSMEALSKCREQGMVRAVGVSCHDFAAFRLAAVSPWVEVVLARINYDGVSMDASPEEVIPVMDEMSARGKGIYGMKVYGAGKLLHDRRRALGYVLDLPSVDAVVLGMENKAEVDENVELVEELAGVPV